MKTIIAVLALLFGFVAQTSAQVGQGKCAWNAEQIPVGTKQQIVPVNDMVLLGISDSEGDPAYSVSLLANISTGKATNVVLTEIKTNKKWLMNQVAPLTKPAPLACNAGQALPGWPLICRSALTNVVVYVSVPFTAGELVHVYAYKPAGPQDIKTKF